MVYSRPSSVFDHEDLFAAAPLDDPEAGFDGEAGKLNGLGDVLLEHQAELLLLLQRCHLPPDFLPQASVRNLADQVLDFCHESLS